MCGNLEVWARSWTWLSGCGPWPREVRGGFPRQRDRRDGGRKTGSKNRKTVERERAKRIAALRVEISKNVPPIDFRAQLDSLDMMEGVMRHFYLRAMIERAVGDEANWDKVNSLLLRTLAAAEKVARYKHAQLSSVRLAGDISGKMDDVSLDELLVTVKQEWAKLGPLISLEAIQVPQG